MNILLTSVGTATSINMIKLMRHSSLFKDITIVGVDINPYGMTAGSILVDKFIQVPLATEEGYFDVILDIIESNSIDAFIPINDIEIEIASLNRDVIPRSCGVLLPSSNVVDLVKNKLKMSLFTEGIGLTCPSIVSLEYSGKRVIRDISGVGSKGFSIVTSEMNDANIINKVNSGQSFLQSFIEGTEYTVDVLSDREGSPLTIIPRARLEVKSGVATKALVEYNDALIEGARLLADQLKIPGFSNIQFIRDSNEDYYFIEVNPRFGGFSIASALAAPYLFDAFLELLLTKDDIVRLSLIRNDEIKWNSIVTRYYSEVLYEI